MKISFIQVGLRRQNELLERIALALERMCPPLHTYVPKIATLDDYSVITEQQQADSAVAKEDFAARNMVTVGSPAYQEAISAYEQAVFDHYGQEGLDSLPWRIPTGEKSVEIAQNGQ